MSDLSLWKNTGLIEESYSKEEEEVLSFLLEKSFNDLLNHNQYYKFMPYYSTILINVFDTIKPFITLEEVKAKIDIIDTMRCFVHHLSLELDYKCNGEDIVKFCGEYSNNILEQCQ